ncbi:MAG: alpha/beta fold hydrolase [Terriglobales bacterium]
MVCVPVYIIYMLEYYTCMYYYTASMAPWQRNLGIAFLFGGFLLSAGYIYQRISERRDRRRNPAPGRMVSVGDHKLHLFCKGSNAPTVVIEQGAGSPSRLWWPVQDRVAEFASVCTYDRAGYLWSGPVPRGRTIAERAEELHTLLVNSGIPGSYVLVAHSYGGLIVRWFARNHPDQMAGLVLVDTPEEGTIFRQAVLNFYSRVRVMSKGWSLPRDSVCCVCWELAFLRCAPAFRLHALRSMRPRLTNWPLCKLQTRRQDARETRAA